jgi:hypothetical protein
LLRAAAAVMLGLCLVGAGNALAAAQPTFKSAEEAVAALIKVVKANDNAAALTILGPGSEKWIRSGDPIADQEQRDRFVALYEQKHTIEQTPKGAVLNLGPDDWPFAFPLVKTSKGWRFDTEAGKKELLARRIGHNELGAINTLLAVVDAQREYASHDHNEDGVREYARSFASTPGKHDGLYWQTAAGDPPSPLGPLLTQAAAEGYAKGNAKGEPYHGYFFRMLKGQGSHAKGGAQEYVVRGHMIGGFGAVAWPAQYGNSGIMTFIVNQEGVVYQKDLGSGTEVAVKKITLFDPGTGWKPAPPE